MKNLFSDAQDRIYIGSGAQLAYERLVDAINASSPKYKAISRVHEVCVGKAKESPLPCSVHVPTILGVGDSQGPGGERYRNGEDYNAVIMN